jgi:hypothetical protein
MEAGGSLPPSQKSVIVHRPTWFWISSIGRSVAIVFLLVSIFNCFIYNYGLNFVNTSSEATETIFLFSCTSCLKKVSYQVCDRAVLGFHVLIQKAKLIAAKLVAFEEAPSFLHTSNFKNVFYTNVKCQFLLYYMFRLIPSHHRVYKLYISYCTFFNFKMLLLKFLKPRKNIYVYIISFL